MKNKFYLFLLLGVLLLLCACEENSQTQKSIVTYENIKPKLPKQKIVVKKEIPKPPKVYHFQFEDLDEQQINIEIKNNIYSFLEFSESIVLINIFATWCPPCVGQIPHLNKLQSKYRDKLFILGTLIHDEPLKDEKLRVFIESQKINFFIGCVINVFPNQPIAANIKKANNKPNPGISTPNQSLKRASRLLKIL